MLAEQDAAWRDVVAYRRAESCSLGYKVSSLSASAAIAKRPHVTWRRLPWDILPSVAATTNRNICFPFLGSFCFSFLGTLCAGDICVLCLWFGRRDSAWEADTWDVKLRGILETTWDKRLYTWSIGLVRTARVSRFASMQQCEHSHWLQYVLVFACACCEVFCVLCERGLRLHDTKDNVRFLTVWDFLTARDHARRATWCETHLLPLWRRSLCFLARCPGLSPTDSSCHSYSAPQGQRSGSRPSCSRPAEK